MVAASELFSCVGTGASGPHTRVHLCAVHFGNPSSALPKGQVYPGWQIPFILARPRPQQGMVAKHQGQCKAKVLISLHLPAKWVAALIVMEFCSFQKSSKSSTFVTLSVICKCTHINIYPEHMHTIRTCHHCI